MDFPPKDFVVYFVVLLCLYSRRADGIVQPNKLSDLTPEPSPVTTPCVSQQTCGACIQASPECAWCKSDQKVYSNISRRCDSVDELFKFCPEEDVVFPVPSGEIKQNDEPTTANQMRPQNMQLKLRPGEKHSFEVRFRQVVDYPLDVYFLLDMSFTMRKYQERLSNLTSTLASELHNITSNFRLGFGSFVDKPTMPFTDAPTDRLRPPCSDCVVTYSFKHQMPLANGLEQSARFESLVKNAKLSGNLDHAEGGLDALMQAVVCKEEIGWRNHSRKLIVFSTDAAYHHASDGKLAGIVVPNDGKCHLQYDDKSDTWDYIEALNQDYPSALQLKRLLRKNKINMIFAVPLKQQPLYSKLSHFLETSVVGLLSDQADNIVQIVRNEYDKITSEVTLSHLSTLPNMRLNYTSFCLGEVSLETAVCRGLKFGSEVAWNVTLELLSCPNATFSNRNHTIKIQPIGLQDQVVIDLEPICQCDCPLPLENAEEGISLPCSGKGKKDCGICLCEKNRLGKNCECQKSAGFSEVDDQGTCIMPNSTWNMVCSGRGNCVCGKCECFKRNDPNEAITGHYCECDNFSCGKDKTGQLCGGHGNCDCGECKCDEGWTAKTCDCPLSTSSCVDPTSNEICNGKGECDCGVCQCERSKGSRVYGGTTCGQCLNCPPPCHLLARCAQCAAFESQKNETSGNNFTAISGACSKDCRYAETSVLLVDNLDTKQKPGWKLCPPVRDDRDFCLISFAYQEVVGSKEEPQLSVMVGQKKVCPEKINPYIIAGPLAGAILLMGILLLVGWKIAVSLYDRQQVRQFEEEVRSAEWQKTVRGIDFEMIQSV
ncbi:hypothetical protein RvY_12184 [Ramazzottius varieornatus]|uniref:Integrin beta n=1 Tax=Ramazzottius varieornatus TaxID=947166 RepID=A0A1D1VP21_RAMVA|nr:hypothetical protein RvY_12184 [Ramazzottius varieornatus]